jgi:hypothetical protein
MQGPVSTRGWFPIKGMKKGIRGEFFNKNRRSVVVRNNCQKHKKPIAFAPSNIQSNKILSLRQWKIGNSILNGCTCSIK